MSLILEKATSPEIMDDVWRKSKNVTAIWRPGISRTEMEKRFIFHMLKLVEDIRSGA